MRSRVRKSFLIGLSVFDRLVIDRAQNATRTEWPALLPRPFGRRLFVCCSSVLLLGPLFGSSVGKGGAGLASPLPFLWFGGGGARLVRLLLPFPPFLFCAIEINSKDLVKVPLTSIWGL